MDLQAGQTAWTKLFREGARAFLRPLKYWRDVRRRFRSRSQGTQLVYVGDAATPILSAWTVTGVPKPGTNISADSRWFVRVTDGAPNTISIYKATGAGRRRQGGRGHGRGRRDGHALGAEQ